MEDLMAKMKELNDLVTSMQSKHADLENRLSEEYIENGKLIILGGTKAKQKKGESVFRSIKKQFNESLK